MQPHPICLGHRGVHNSSKVSENTLPAFDLALEQGCDGFEFDLRLTADGQAVVCHDSKIQGMSIAKTRCGKLRGIPRLEEIVGRYSGRAFLDIELKVPGLEKTVLAALRECPPEREYVVSSFLPSIVVELKARSAVVPVGIICQKPSQLMGWRKLPVEYVIVHKSLITRRLIQVIHGAGRRIFAWTVNDKPSMLRLAGWGVDAIISDKPQLLVETFNSNGHAVVPAAGKS